MAENDWALVVGISVYPDPELGNLDGSENDARAFYDWVVSPTGGAVPPDNAELVVSSNFQSRMPFKSAARASPSHGDIHASFDDMVRRIQDGEGSARRLYLYFSGHGIATHLEVTALLTANAEFRTPGYNIPGKPFADWFYQSGIFQEIFLLMDCCRQNRASATAMLPAYINVNSVGSQLGKRFYAFGTKWSRLARERQMADGQVHGVFTAALLDGLRGGAADPITGEITTASLKSYLYQNMKTLLNASDLEDEDVAKEPEVDCREDFVIARAPIPRYPVTIEFPKEAAGRTLRIYNSALQQVQAVETKQESAELDLPKGLYVARIDSTGFEEPFEVNSTAERIAVHLKNVARRTDVVQLRVKTEDDAAEIFLLDGKLNMVRQAVGALEAEAAPGIYKLKVRTGVDTKEDLVVLRDIAVERRYGGLQFSSAAPLNNTSRTARQHVMAAIEESGKVHVTAGNGSSIFVFTGLWRPKLEIGVADNLYAESFVLRRFDGSMVAELGRYAIQTDGASPWAACNVQLDPGNYRLTARFASGPVLEKTIVAVAGWQTQIFIQLRNDAASVAEEVRRGLIGTAMFMTREQRFDPDSRAQRLTEIARHALAHERPIVSDELREYLRDKLDNPLFGIFCGHLLMRGRSKDQDLVRAIVDNLREIVGDRHPDVEAIAIAAGVPTDHIFTEPPMLRRSWLQVLSATAEHPELVPLTSFSSNISSRVQDMAPWLIYDAPESHSADESEVTGLDSIAKELARRQKNVALGPEAIVTYLTSSQEVPRLIRLLGLPRLRIEDIVRKALRPAVAILPFSDFSPDKDQEHLCHGLAEELITALGRLENLHVASRTASFRYKIAEVDLKKIAKDLGVNSILEGSVQKSGDRLRIVVKLIDLETGDPVWSEKYDRTMDDIFAIQDEISKSVVEKLKIAFTSRESEKVIQAVAPQNVRAYELYLKGRFFWNKRTEESLKLSITHFEQALEADPDYALAHAGLADAYVTLCLYGEMPPLEAMSLAKKGADRALEINPELPEALTARACVRAIFDWEWESAAREFDRAILLNPRYAQARQWYAINCLCPLGKFEDARSELQQAARLEPVSLAIAASLGVLLFFERKYGEAISQFQSVISLEEGFQLAHYFLGQAYAEKQMFAESLAELERASAMTHASAESAAALGYAQALAGEAGKAQEALKSLNESREKRYVSPVLIAQLHMGLKDYASAIASLQEAFELRATDLIWLNVSPAFDAIRSDRRVVDLLAKIGLLPSQFDSAG